MIQLRTTRDEARLVQQHFLPYLLLHAERELHDAITDAEKMIYLIMDCLVKEVKKAYDKKLLTTANKFYLKFSDAQAVCFYQLLMDFPIDRSQAYMVMVRQKIMDRILAEITNKEILQADQPDTYDLQSV
jgi:hypothetical protein